MKTNPNSHPQDMLGNTLDEAYNFGNIIIIHHIFKILSKTQHNFRIIDTIQHIFRIFNKTQSKFSIINKTQLSYRNKLWNDKKDSINFMIVDTFDLTQ